MQSVLAMQRCDAITSLLCVSSDIAIAIPCFWSKKKDKFALWKAHARVSLFAQSLVFCSSSAFAMGFALHHLGPFSAFQPPPCL